MEKSLLKLVSALEDWFAGKKRVAVAFSGGVDSSLLFFLGSKTLGSHCRGLFAKSPLTAKHQVDTVRSFSKQFGLNLVEKTFSPLELAGFAENNSDRCYVCKKAVYKTFTDSLAPGWILADGTNLDDNLASRPGFKAIQELEVSTPFLECGANKKQIREISRDLKLPSWNRPSDSCLATRIQPPNPISEEFLQQVEVVENILHDLGFEGVRANFYGDAVCLTFNEGDLERALIPEVRKKIEKKLKQCSFFKVFLDLSERRGILP